MQARVRSAFTSSASPVVPASFVSLGNAGHAKGEGWNDGRSIIAVLGDGDGIR